MARIQLVAVALTGFAALVACKSNTVSTLSAAPPERPAPVPTHNGSFDPMACDNAGPQTPRDVTGAGGRNNRIVPGSERTTSTAGMRICSVHFHKHAEHKARGEYDVAMGNAGFACRAKQAAAPSGQGEGEGSRPEGQGEGDGSAIESFGGEASTPEAIGALDPYGNAGYALAGSHGHGDVAEGDTVEFHWVHTTCSQEHIDAAIAAALRADPKKDTGLSPCACPGAKVVVEARVFRITKDEGLDRIANAGPTAAGGNLVRYYGSTTGPKYNGRCSPIQAGWSVDDKCVDLKLSALQGWLAGDAKVFNETHAHGTRELIEREELLSPFER